MDEKKYVKLVLSLIAGIALVLAVAIIIIDPYFHYHKPIDGLVYKFHTDEERYVNDGIVRHFDYDAIIAGTSMIENFKTSECDELFGVTSVKVPLNGGYYNEVNRLLKNALKSNPDIKYIFRSIDYSMMDVDKDITRLGEENFPTYLYDENPFNDVSYIFNKAVLMECVDVVRNTINGETSTTFDEYANWSDEHIYGRGPILYWHARAPKLDTQRGLSDEERERIIANVEQNIASTVRENPDVTFYLFIPPYSVYYWDTRVQSGELEYQVEMERVVIEQLIGYDNVKFFAFSNNFDVTSDEYNYQDPAHYGEWINSDMLEWMAEGKYQVTEENYEAYLAEITEFYSTFDYDSMYIY